jgi:hypothetical protein
VEGVCTTHVKPKRPLHPEGSETRAPDLVSTCRSSPGPHPGMFSRLRAVDQPGRDPHLPERTRSPPPLSSAPDHPRTKANVTPLLSVAAILNTKRLAEKANPREPDRQISRIRLSDKTSRPSPKPAQAYEPEVPGRHGTKRRGLPWRMELHHLSQQSLRSRR